ncbi:hypothetical protein AB7X32_22590 [Morganella morganii]
MKVELSEREAKLITALLREYVNEDINGDNETAESAIEKIKTASLAD